MNVKVEKMSDSDSDSFVHFGQQTASINSDAPGREEVESGAITTRRDDNRAPLLRRSAAAREKLSKWSVLRHFVIPIEAVSFFFVFTMSFSTQVTQAYLFQRIFSDYDVDTNVTANGSVQHDCLDEELIINQTGHYAFIKGLNKISNYNMGNSLLYLIPSLVLTVVLGPISDILGRKPFIFLVQVGQVLGVVVALVTVHYRLHVSIFFLGSLVSGVLGGLGAMLSLSFSYVTDITPQSWLTIRMGSLEASFYLGFVASASLANALISKTGCDFAVPMWIVLSTSIVGLIVCVVLPEESRNKDPNKSSLSRRDPRYTDEHCSRVLIRGFKLLFWKSDLSKDLWNVWLLIAVLAIAFFNIVGITQMVLYFLINKPLQWNFAAIDIFHAVTSTSHISIIVVILPLLVLYNVPDVVISFAGSIVACGMCIFIALLSQPWEMFLG